MLLAKSKNTLTKSGDPTFFAERFAKFLRFCVTQNEAETYADTLRAPLFYCPLQAHICQFSNKEHDTSITLIYHGCLEEQHFFHIIQFFWYLCASGTCMLRAIVNNLHYTWMFLVLKKSQTRVPQSSATLHCPGVGCNAGKMCVRIPNQGRKRSKLNPNQFRVQPG